MYRMWKKMIKKTTKKGKYESILDRVFWKHLSELYKIWIISINFEHILGVLIHKSEV